MLHGFVTIILFNALVSAGSILNVDCSKKAEGDVGFTISPKVGIPPLKKISMKRLEQSLEKANVKDICGKDVLLRLIFRQVGIEQYNTVIKKVDVIISPNSQLGEIYKYDLQYNIVDFSDEKPAVPAGDKIMVYLNVYENFISEEAVKERFEKHLL